MMIRPAERTAGIREYYFSLKNREIAGLNSERAARGEEPLLNLGIGSPDMMPPAAALSALVSAAGRADVHGYQGYTGIPELRAAMARWYSRYYGVSLDPACEIQPLMGSKEGILIISLAFLDEGDKVLIPDPGYPTYTSASLMAGGRVIRYDLEARRGWMPDLDRLDSTDLEGVKLMWTNFPGMPTGARPTADLFARLADFGRRHNILIVNDNPYSFIRNANPLSILAAPGAKECCLELNSLSKAHNMAGWRIGMVAGAADYITEILKVKSQIDSGMFKPLQLAAAEALDSAPEWFDALNSEYRLRAEAAGAIMDLLGVEYDRDSAGLFLFGRVPSRFCEGPDDGRSPGERLSDEILHKAGVFITPGAVFGRNGGEYVRISLCSPAETFARALERIKAM